MIDEATLATVEKLVVARKKARSKATRTHAGSQLFSVMLDVLPELIAAARERDELRTALESQRQATEEAMRRAEEARRELVDWKRVNLRDALGRPHKEVR